MVALKEETCITATDVSLTFVYMPNMSVLANDGAKSAQDILDPLIQYLENHGYTQY